MKNQSRLRTGEEDALEELVLFLPGQGETPGRRALALLPAALL